MIAEERTAPALPDWYVDAQPQPTKRELAREQAVLEERAKVRVTGFTAALRDVYFPAVLAEDLLSTTWAPHRVQVRLSNVRPQRVLMEDQIAQLTEAAQAVVDRLAPEILRRASAANDRDLAPVAAWVRAHNYETPLPAALVQLGAPIVGALVSLWRRWGVDGYVAGDLDNPLNDGGWPPATLHRVTWARTPSPTGVAFLALRERAMWVTTQDVSVFLNGARRR